MDGSQVVVAQQKPKLPRGNAIKRWEISVVKAMLAKLDETDQDILAYFTRPRDR